MTAAIPSSTFCGTDPDGNTSATPAMPVATNAATPTRSPKVASDAGKTPAAGPHG